MTESAKDSGHYPFDTTQQISADKSGRRNQQHRSEVH